MSLFSGAIYWSTTPSNMRVRVGGAMVHHVLQLVGGDDRFDEALLECGARARRDDTTETMDPVDCMGCMIQRTTESMEAEFAEQEAAYKEWVSQSHEE